MECADPVCRSRHYQQVAHLQGSGDITPATPSEFMFITTRPATVAQKLMKFVKNGGALDVSGFSRR
jgi:hypothetical protein